MPSVSFYFNAAPFKSELLEVRVERGKIAWPPVSPVVFSLGVWFAFRFFELYTIASTILQQHFVILPLNLVFIHLSYMS